MKKQLASLERELEKQKEKRIMASYEPLFYKRLARTFSPSPFEFYPQSQSPPQTQTPTMFGKLGSEMYFRNYFANQKSKGKAPQTSTPPKKTRSSTFMLSSSTNSIESIQVEVAPKSPNLFTKTYF